MRIASFHTEAGRGLSFGVVRDDEIVDLGGRSEIDSLLAVVTDPAIARTLAESAPADYRVDEVEFTPPVPRPGKILCVGVNYRDRNAEYKDGSEAPRFPSIFTRTPESLVGHESSLLRPPESPQLDYEGEIALVIGRGGRRIPEAQAGSHIAGVCCANEGSVRDWMRHGKFNVTQGKNFDASGSMGPWLVTSDELDPLSNLRVESRVNGALRQSDETDNLSFPFAYLIHYISTFTTLNPGDVISTGTPRGAGIHQEPPVFLEPGDVVEVEVSGVGVLRNTVIDET